MRFLFAIITFIVLVFSMPLFAADVTTSNNPATINVIGQIDQFTPKQISAAVMDIRSSTPGTVPIILRFNSLGGDVEAAIKAGNIARKEDMFTIIPETWSCASACALTFLGGVVRLVAGNYGIHRPYTTKFSDFDTDAKRSYERINKMVGDYLIQMNISPRVLEAMNHVSPGDIRWLTNDELNDYGISGNDPVSSDRRDSAYSRSLGITKTELYKREQRAKSLCFGSRLSVEQADACYDDIINGRR
jgi:hypothetical protein